MTNNIVREVDRAIGALSTLALGVGLLMLREVYRSLRTSQDKWERCDLDGGGKDVFYQKKYGMPQLPLFQHRGGCDCGSLRFMVLAPKRVEAFDDSNTLSCKKGRFPYLMVPTSCFEMMESSDVSLYESQATLCQHVFCAACGVHIFQFDSTQPDCVAVNVYCVEDENFEDMKIIFIPRGSRPLFGRASRQPLSSGQRYRRPLQAQGFDTVREDSDESTIAFQKQMMMWARMDNHEKYREPLSDDTQSSTSTASQAGRFSAASSEDVPSVTKDQLEFYLKHPINAFFVRKRAHNTKTCYKCVPMTSHGKNHLQPNYYDVLGVDRAASTDDIKAAYRKLVLEHHPDRSHVKRSSSSSRPDGKDAQILRINAAYDLLSDDAARVKYDMDMFGVSAASNDDEATRDAVNVARNYKPMSSQDVHEMFGGLNSYERFTTAQYHRLRSHVAPAAIGRRATNLLERKQFRAANSKLPTQTATLAWLAFPIALAALWGVNVSNIKEQCKKR